LQFVRTFVFFFVFLQILKSFGCVSLVGCDMKAITQSNLSVLSVRCCPV
jgi:hypothetical protein